MQFTEDRVVRASVKKRRRTKLYAALIAILPVLALLTGAAIAAIQYGLLL